MFWKPHKVLSYNALFNFIVGNRGAGKTFGSLKTAIKRYKKTGAQFVYLRRWKTEFDGFEKILNPLRSHFPNDELEVKGKILYINGEVMGYGVALSTALTKKGIPFERVELIIFDEFIIDSKVLHYISGEVTHFLEFYETVTRLRDNVVVLFLSNAVSISNPYFLYWNLKPNPNKQFSRYGHIVVEYIHNEEFRQAKYKTRFGQIIKGTKYGDYAVDNKFLKDNDTFVERKTGNSRNEFSLIFNGRQYGVWTDYNVGMMFISEDYDPSQKIVFALTDDEHKPNVMLVRSASKSFYLKQLLDAYDQGYLRFDDMTTKNQALEIFSLLKS